MTVLFTTIGSGAPAVPGIKYGSSLVALGPPKAFAPVQFPPSFPATQDATTPVTATTTIEHVVDAFIEAKPSAAPLNAGGVSSGWRPYDMVLVARDAPSLGASKVAAASGVMLVGSDAKFVCAAILVSAVTHVGDPVPEA